MANNILRDNKFGMMFRVAVGACLSTVDILSDIFVIVTYYREGLGVQASALLGMITASVFLQLLFALNAQYKQFGWRVKLKEALVTLFFMRPAVDAFRVSTNHKDVLDTTDSFTAMLCNKVSLWWFLDGGTNFRRSKNDEGVRRRSRELHQQQQI